ncbi:MAG: rhomboid family intramembrane serine protease [Bacteroidales bacterium]|jgi:membrane associated rhomboid family serine protease|nr:rhomboid family intramembrane serine protease [Bacteroidales bacterium]
MSSGDSNLPGTSAFYRKKFFLSIIIPGIFIFFMWLVKITEVLFEADFSGFGIHPLTINGLPGIFLSPFIHKDFNHLFNNSLPLFFLSVALFYFYSEVALKVFTWTFLLTGILVWFGGREAWHIGASGLVYGLASFLFFSGIIRRYYRLIALSLLVVFLYGEMVWGIFPGVYQNISWESHMLGFFSGILLAIVFRKQGPQMPVYEWMKEKVEGVEIVEEVEGEKK